ncbi:hypothetical protein ACFY5C_17445 [Streptomyces sp. NPDC012935]|uniref:hypothetical protein n=1 Tax=Streptomyces sp. NPDC012935 TaxID=3364857 RepID=UPI0036B02A82
MANTKNKRRQRGSIRPNGAGFQVRVYAGRDPLTKKDIYLHEQADTEVEAEKARTKLLHQVDENRHPKTQVTMSFLLDRWLGVAEHEETSHDRAEGIIRNYLKPDSRTSADDIPSTVVPRTTTCTRQQQLACTSASMRGPRLT